MAKATKKAKADATANPHDVKVELSDIVAATKEGSFLYVDPASVAAYTAEGLVEINPGLVNEQGHVAARATPKALESSETANMEQSAPRFVITGTNPSIFTAKRRGGGGRPEIYPFDDLVAPVDGVPAQDGGMFFVPATEQSPEPWKSLSSTVSAASRRYAREVGTEEYQTKNGETKTRTKLEYDRRFKVVEGENDGVKGAWIGRIL